MYRGPIFHTESFPPPPGHEDDPVEAKMNSGMDAPWLTVSGPVNDLRAHMLHHGAYRVNMQGEYPTLDMLADCADLITELAFSSAEDASALAALTRLHTLEGLPAEADELLPKLTSLRRLTLYQASPPETLRDCKRLRELRLWDPPIEDLQGVPALDQLELLWFIGAHSLRSFAGIERFGALRTLGFESTVLRRVKRLPFLEARFGFRERDWRALRRRGAWQPLRFDADRVVAEREAAPMGAKSEYTGPVTAEQPACVILLVDRSASMEQQFGIDMRVVVRPDEPLHHMTTRYGDGPDGAMSIGEGVAQAINGFLRGLVERCIAGGRVVHDVHVGIVEYGARVGSAWGGALSGRTIVPIAEIAEHPLRGAADQAVWIEAEWSGETPLGPALEQAHMMAAAWALEYPSSFPPIVVNLMGGRPGSDDVSRHAWAIRSVRTREGAGLLFHVERANRLGRPHFGIEGFHMSEAEELFHLSSRMPACMTDAARRAGYPLIRRPRGYFQDASAADFENVLHIFTTLPGIPWRESLVRHPLPPYTVTKQELEDEDWFADQPERTPAAWKPPKVRGPMTKELFWKLIDLSRRGSPGVEEQGDRLVRLLEQLSERDILAFHRLLHQRINEAYRWDLWAVAFIAQGGCSDDGFEYFCCWLVAQGRRYFEASLANATNAAKGIAPGDQPSFELLLAVAPDAYGAKTGKGDFPDRAAPVRRVAPRGKEWKEEDLPGLYPKLVRKYA